MASLLGKWSLLDLTLLLHKPHLFPASLTHAPLEENVIEGLVVPSAAEQGPGKTAHTNKPW